MVHNDAKMGIPVLLVIWQSKPAIPRKTLLASAAPAALIFKFAGTWASPDQFYWHI
jgi:hypothetical protein